MKRLISAICLMVLCLSFVSLAVLAASADMTTSGPATVEVGQTFDVSLVLNGSDLHGLQGKISYDANKIRVNSITAAKTGWDAEAYNENFLAYDKTGDYPINGSAAVIVVNVTVLAGDVGSTVNVTFSSLVATDAKNDTSMSDVTYTFTIAAPPTEPPVTEPPATEPPATEPPATEPPATEPPATEPPATEPSTAPTTEPTKPVTEPGAAAPQPGEEHECQWWWLLIILALICISVWLAVENKKLKQKNKK